MTLAPTGPDPAAGAVAAIVMAAGRGVRMHSRIPKVLHPVGGVPMVRRVVDALTQASITQIVVCAGPDPGPIRQVLPDGVVIAIQAEPRGTGDAVEISLAAIPPSVRTVVVIGGDTPLVTPATIRELVQAMRRGDDAAGRQPVISICVAELGDPAGYGRVVLGQTGGVERIVEEANASAEERLIRLADVWPFAFDATWLRQAIVGLKPSASGERYLTDLIADAVREGQRVQAVTVADPAETVGVNTRRQLAEVEAVLRRRVCDRLMDAGVTIVDPASTYVEESVSVARDVVIHPQSFLRGQTTVGEGSVIGPGADVTNCRLGKDVQVRWSVIEDAQIADRVQIGPYARVRAGTILGDDVQLGSFAEVKNSTVGRGTQMHHFSYLGDAQVGADVNIGAGAVTCNFDGKDKYETVIGDGAFIGSDTMLIAPVAIGAGAATGAGSVVTHDVPAGGRVAGVPARPMSGNADENSKRTEHR